MRVATPTLMPLSHSGEVIRRGFRYASQRLRTINLLFVELALCHTIGFATKAKQAVAKEWLAKSGRSSTV